MKEFLLLYRTDYKAMAAVSPEAMQATTQKWMDWISSIDSKGKLFDRGRRLSSDGRVLKSNNVVTDGPYTDIKESVGGYSVIKADSYDEAVEIAKGCPILNFGGNVEIREINL